MDHTFHDNNAAPAGAVFTIAGVPLGGPETVAQLIYINGASEPSWAVLRGANGQFQVPGAIWRLLELLQRSGSRFVVLALSLALGACAYHQLPIAPTPIPIPPVRATPTELRAFYHPLEVYANGATQIHVGAFWYDGLDLRSIAGVPVTFRTDAGTLDRTHAVTPEGFAVAVLTVDARPGAYTIHVSIGAGGLQTIVPVQACGCVPNAAERPKLPPKL